MRPVQTINFLLVFQILGVCNSPRFPASFSFSSESLAQLAPSVASKGPHAGMEVNSTTVRLVLELRPHNTPYFILVW